MIQNYAKKTYNKAKKVVKKRYFSGKGYSNPDYSQIIKDIGLLKSVINSEKKRLTMTSTSAVPIGQVNINATGNIAFDVTPLPAESLTVSGRSGASIKLHSSYYEFQFFQQINRNSIMKMKLYIVEVIGQPQNSNIANNQFFNPNPFVTGGTAIYDFNSVRNPDFFTQYKIIVTKSFTLLPDNTNSEITIKNIQIPIKYGNGQGMHVRYNGDSTNVAGGQLLCFIVADSGNMAGTVSTVNNIPINASGTGAQMNYNITHYYYDN